jgi:predicted MPP superfamily phosphohydrolase
MFHLYISLAYIIPGIYVFFRIKNLFISKGYKHWYSIVFLFLASIYPVSEQFSDRELNLPLSILAAISGYMLPFFLYLFLCVLLFDMLLLLNLLVRILPSETRKSFSFRVYSLTAMIILSVGVVVAGSINLNTIRASEFQVTVPKGNSSIDHLKVAFVADFHIQENTQASFVEQFVRKVNAFQPDLMLFGGDIVEGDRENETTEVIESALRSIQAKYGVYGVPGNHEFNRKRESVNFYRKAGISLLCDTILQIENAFYLAGRYDQRLRERKTINEILGENSYEMPVILMDHRPTELTEVSQTEVDMQFSGHTHEGQLFPINLIVQNIYELSWGYQKIRNTHFFVTSGLRLWGPPVKTAGKSEIMLVEIHFE